MSFNRQQCVVLTSELTILTGLHVLV